MIKNFKKLEEVLVLRAREMGKGCSKVFVAVSGGIDSATVAALLCKAYGSENVVGMYRDIKSDKKHQKDVLLLRKKLGLKVIFLDLNDIYDEVVGKIKREFKKNGLKFVEEKSKYAEGLGFTGAYSSMKSRFTTPLAGFIAKAIDGGHGRIFGTGNGEEDGFLRYFDKYGDGAVDNNLLAGLNKAEVRQLARHLGVPEKIITKLPSADLEGNGDKHNDESQLTSWAKKLGYRIKVSYGTSDGQQEGNIAWAWREDMRIGVVTGRNSAMRRTELVKKYGSNEKAEIILFLRDIEKATRHKVLPLPVVGREELIKMGLVD
jgi:NAD+ synthase